jgi:hypothetical protein
MTATFWTGSSLSFTNGSKTVTVNTGPSLDSVKANSSLTAGNYNEPVEVKSVSGNTIILYNNWPGSTGTTSATIKPSAAAAASAGASAQNLIAEIQNLVGSSNVLPVANSFPKRDSSGRLLTGNAVSGQQAVNFQQLGDCAFLGSYKLFGVGEAQNKTNLDFEESITNGFELSFFSSSQNAPSFFSANERGWLINLGAVGSSARAQLAFDFDNNVIGYRRRNGADWVELYHSGNISHSQNVSASSVAPNDVIAGSGLEPSKTGSWRNISGVTINNGNYGLWRKV